MLTVTRDTHAYCRVLSSGAVITCFYDLGLSRLGFEHPTFRLRGLRSNRLRHRRGKLVLRQSIDFKMYKQLGKFFNGQFLSCETGLKFEECDGPVKLMVNSI